MRFILINIYLQLNFKEEIDFADLLDKFKSVQNSIYNTRIYEIYVIYLSKLNLYYTFLYTLFAHLYIL